MARCCAASPAPGPRRRTASDLRWPVWTTKTATGATISGSRRLGVAGLYRMNAQGAVLADLRDPTPGAPPPIGAFGSSLAATADLSGDGKRDVVIGEPAEPAAGQMNAGAAYLVIDNPPAGGQVRAGDGVRRRGCSADVMAGEVDDGSTDPDGDPIVLTLAPAGSFGARGHARHAHGDGRQGGHGDLQHDAHRRRYDASVAVATQRAPPRCSGRRTTGSSTSTSPTRRPTTAPRPGRSPAPSASAVTSPWRAWGMATRRRTGSSRVPTASDCVRSGVAAREGRTYSVTVSCQDEAANAVGAAVFVVVPHHR